MDYYAGFFFFFFFGGGGGGEGRGVKDFMFDTHAMPLVAKCCGNPTLAARPVLVALNRLYVTSFNVKTNLI